LLHAAGASSTATIIIIDTTNVGRFMGRAPFLQDLDERADITAFAFGGNSVPGRN
jgi:hypothetical protein